MFLVFRVPLIISHPQSPNKGMHYKQPVELIDIYPTLNDIMGLSSYDRKKDCMQGNICPPLSGKSLASVILGSHSENIKKKKYTSKSIFSFGSTEKTNTENTNKRQLQSIINDNISNNNFTYVPIILDQTYAISQTLRCAKKLEVMQELTNLKNSIPNQMKLVRKAIWSDCDLNKNPPSEEMSIMGYSMRTSEYRYNGWFHFNREKKLPILDIVPFLEELYDHRGEILSDFKHLETINLVNKGGHENIVLKEREKLIEIIKKKIIFRGK